MTEKGDPSENAIAERVNGILKTEWIYDLKCFDEVDRRPQCPPFDQRPGSTGMGIVLRHIEVVSNSSLTQVLPYPRPKSFYEFIKVIPDISAFPFFRNA